MTQSGLPPSGLSPALLKSPTDGKPSAVVNKRCASSSELSAIAADAGGPGRQVRLAVSQNRRALPPAMSESSSTPASPAQVIPIRGREERRHLVERRENPIRRVVSERFPIGAAVDPDAPKADVPCSHQVEMRIRADVDDIVFRHTELPIGILKNDSRRLVGAGLLGGEDPIDMAAELRNIAGNDVVVGVGDNARLAAVR